MSARIGKMRSEIYMRKIIVEVGQKVYFDPFADVHNAYGVDFLRGGNGGYRGFYQPQGRLVLRGLRKAAYQLLFQRDRKEGIP